MNTKSEEPTRVMSRREVARAVEGARRSSAKMRAAVAQMDEQLATFLVAEVRP